MLRVAGTALMLSEAAILELDDAGFTDPKVIRVRGADGKFDVLIEATIGPFKWRGWLKHGDTLDDITWHANRREGWNPSVSTEKEGDNA